MAAGSITVDKIGSKGKIRIYKVNYTAHATPANPDTVIVSEKMDGLLHGVRVVKGGTAPTGATTLLITDDTGRTPFGAAFTFATAVEKRAIYDSVKAAIPHVNGFTLVFMNNVEASATATVYFYVEKL